MNSNPEKDFNQNMNQLLNLLKQIIKDLPLGISSPKSPISKDKDSGIHVNFCFFNFLPMTDEEIEAMDSLYDQYLHEEEEKMADFSPELSAADKDFLRRNGIRF